MGGGHERRAEWGYLSGALDTPAKTSLVSWALKMELVGSEGVAHVWKQKLEERQHSLLFRRSIMAAPSTALPLSPSKFNFVPKTQNRISSHNGLTCPAPASACLLQVGPRDRS